MVAMRLEAERKFSEASGEKQEDIENELSSSKRERDWKRD